jgi:hypothetical protein
MSKLADCRRCDELEAVPGKGMRCRRGGGFIEPEDLGPISDMGTEGRLCAFDGPFGYVPPDRPPQQLREGRALALSRWQRTTQTGRTLEDELKALLDAEPELTDAERAERLSAITGKQVTMQAARVRRKVLQGIAPSPQEAWQRRKRREAEKARSARGDQAAMPAMRADGLEAPSSAAAPLPPREGFVLSSLVAAFVAHKGLDPAEWQAFRAGWEAALEVTA